MFQPIRNLRIGSPAPSTSSFSPLTAEHRKRQELFATYWRYYRGDHKRQLKIRDNEPDDNVVLNYSKRVVNKGVQFLFGKPVQFEIDRDTKGRTPEEEYIDRVWGTDEEKHTLLQSIALNGAVTGSPVVRLYEPVANVADGLPRIVNLDPLLLDIVTADDDVTEIVSYRLVWRVGDVWKRHRFDRDIERGTWAISEETAKNGSDKWIITAEPPWPWPFAPLVTAQNMPNPNAFWGISDLEEADLNDAINFTASNINRVLKFYAHPRTIGFGFASNQIMPTAVDQLWSISNPEARVQMLEMQGDMKAAYDYLAALKNAYAKITGVPELDPAQVNVGALSGFALRILYGDLLEATQTKRNTYGGLLNEVNKRVLALGNVAAYGTMDVKNVWQDPLPSNEKERAETLAILKGLGLSDETALERAGFDAEKESELRANEQAQQDNIGAGLLRAFETGGQAQ